MKKIFRLTFNKPLLNWFDVLPKITLANFDNTFSIFLGFLWFSGEIAYIKKDYRR